MGRKKWIAGQKQILFPSRSRIRICIPKLDLDLHFQAESRSESRGQIYADPDLQLCEIGMVGYVLERSLSVYSTSWYGPLAPYHDVLYVTSSRANSSEARQCTANHSMVLAQIGEALESV
jgi:hypothetical protein